MTSGDDQLLDQLTDRGLWTVVRRICTPAEVAALETRERLRVMGQHHGYRRVAEELGKEMTTVRDQIRSARARLQRAMAER